MSRMSLRRPPVPPQRTLSLPHGMTILTTSQSTEPTVLENLRPFSVTDCRVTDIHATMLTDKVRTSAYASFILGTPNLFNEAVVLDVGCGTGILSMFAARSGAKRVYAVDASDIVKRAEKIIKVNGHDDVITYVSLALSSSPYTMRNLPLLPGAWPLTRYSITSGQSDSGKNRGRYSS